MIKLVPASLLVFVSIFSLAFASSNDLSVSKAENLIISGQSQEAIPLLQDSYRKYFCTPNGEKAAVLLTECYLRTHDSENAEKTNSQFLEYYITSPYLERMEINSAILKIEKGKIYEGMETLLRVFAYTKNPAAKSRARDVAIQTLAASLLDANELKTLLEKYSVNQSIIGWMELQLGRECQNDKRYKAARYWYKKVVAANVSESLTETAEKGLESLENVGAGVPCVLLLVPLSGEYSTFGTAALQGVLLAQEQSKIGQNFRIRVEDTRADAAMALRRTQQAVNQDSVVAVIGPIMSAPSATVAAWMGANFQHIPMLTPTATDNGIAKMGPNIFQVNITMNHLATSIADFAIHCLDIHEFAVMAPLGDYGNVMAEDFTRAVERRGGKIVAYQDYEEGRPDYSTEFKLLRNARFQQENRRRNIALGRKNLNSISWKERRSYMQDSVFSFQGIFIPATNPADAGSMVEQVAFHKITGILLGSSGWYGRDFLINGKNLVDSTYFSVPSLDLDKNNAYEKFASSFNKKWGFEPGKDKVSGLSFDAANIVFSSLEKSPENLVNAINWTSKYPGIYGDIIFKHGENINVKILTVQKRHFEVQSCNGTVSSAQ